MVTRLFMLALIPLLVTAGSTASEVQTKAYLTETGANVVSVIDTVTATVLGTIPVGAGPSRVVMTRDGSRAYVTNGASDSISVIDTATDMVVATISVGDGPSSLAVTPDGHALYVMTTAGVIEVVDTAQQVVTARIPVGSEGDIAITPDGGRVYVAAGLVYIIDTATNKVIKSFAAETASSPDVSNNASSVAISPDGTRAYVGMYTFNTTNGGFSAGGSVVLVDTATESVTGAINLFSLPGSLAVTPDGSRLYVGIQSTFFNGQPFTSSTMSNVKFKMVFTPDGKMTREPVAKTGAKAEGTWKLSKEAINNYPAVDDLPKTL